MQDHTIYAGSWFEKMSNCYIQVLNDKKRKLKDFISKKNHGCNYFHSLFCLSKVAHVDGGGGGGGGCTPVFTLVYNFFFLKPKALTSGQKSTVI